MIMTFPSVNDNGEVYGGEVAIRFNTIIAIERMFKYDFQAPRPPGGGEVKVIIADCCTVYLNNTSFDIKASYDDLLAKFKELTEYYGT